MRRKLENFPVMVGDVALCKTTRNHIPMVEVAYTSDESVRGLFTYEDVQLYSGNIPANEIEYVANKVKANKKYLER